MPLSTLLLPGGRRTRIIQAIAAVAIVYHYARFDDDPPGGGAIILHAAAAALVWGWAGAGVLTIYDQVAMSARATSEAKQSIEYVTSGEAGADIYRSVTEETDSS